MAVIRRWSTILFFELDRNTVVHDQIVNGIIQKIKSGHLEPGMLLPSYRELATLLRVNRHTIAQVYEELSDRGILYSVRRKGTYVATKVLQNYQQGSNFCEKPASLAMSSNFSFSNFAANVLTPDIPLGHWRIRFDDGYPDPQLTPNSKFISAYKRMALRCARQKKAEYDSSNIYHLLVREICNILRSRRSLNVDVKNICTIHSTRMALYMVAKTILQPGDSIAIEDPCSTFTWQTFQQMGVKLISIPVDNEGIHTSILEETCNHTTIKAVFVSPNCQYPTTVTMSQARRTHLLTLSKQHKFAIIETDHNHEFCYDMGRTLPIASSNIEGNTVYISNVSRLMAPLNLMAFVAGPRDFVRSLQGLYNSVNPRGDTILEQAVTEMLKTDVIGQFARKSLKVYQYRRDIMSKYLDEHLNGFAHYEIPLAGLAYCVKLPLIRSVPDLRRKLMTDKIWIPPDDLITSKQNKENIIRLGFASHSASELARGITEIANIIK